MNENFDRGGGNGGIWIPRGKGKKPQRGEAHDARKGNKWYNLTGKGEKARTVCKVTRRRATRRGQASVNFQSAAGAD